MKTPSEIVRDWEMDLDKAVDKMIDTMGIKPLKKNKTLAPALCGGLI